MNKVATVSELVNYAKARLDQDPYLKQLWVAGELSNLTLHRSGHVYFTLKDEFSRLNCVMFASHLKGQRFSFENGHQVIVNASLSIFTTSGQMQLYVTQIKAAGLGNLFQQFEALKEKLQAEGIFDIKYKKPLPTYPLSIGIISGRDSAALQDILTTLKRRWPLATRYLYYSLVQGEGASAELVARLHQADQNNHDVLIMARGGGSLEDLWAFNEEPVVRAVFKLKTPIIVGVGHESDLTLAELVADLRAPTPTGAAELATMKQEDLINQLTTLKRRYRQLTNQRLLYAKQQLLVVTQRRYFANPEELINDYRLKLLFYNQKLSLWQTKLTTLKQHFQSTKQNYLLLIKAKLKDKQHEFSKSIELLQAYSPLKTLERGYSITTHQNQTITSITLVAQHDIIESRVNDGIITSQVIKKESR